MTSADTRREELVEVVARRLAVVANGLPAEDEDEARECWETASMGFKSFAMSEAAIILDALTAAGVDLEGWQEIESAPKNGPDFIATDGKDIRRAWRSAPSSNSDRIVTFNQWNFSKATHWRPLLAPPTPPKDKP